jgi:hypothetical protein
MDAFILSLSDQFETVIISNEDFTLQPKDHSSSKWMRVKYLAAEVDCRLNKQFEDYLLIFYARAFKHYYLIPKNKIPDLCSIRICKKLSKYNEYKSTRSDLENNLLNYYNSSVKLYEKEIAISDTLIVQNTPKTKVKFTFHDVCDLVKKRECKVVSDESEYTTTKGPIKIKYACEHVEETTYNCFMRKRVTLCRTCICKHYKDVNYDNENKAPIYNIKESMMFSVIQASIANEFDVVKTHEQCLADMIIKPKHISSDEWLPIQLKGHYSDSCQFVFQIKNNDYNNIIVLCYAEQDNRLWMFNGSMIAGLQSLSIGKKLSKYSNYEIKNNSLSETLSKAYSNCMYDGRAVILQTQKFWMQPNGTALLVEHSHRIRREYSIGNVVTITYPNIDASRTDCFINGLNVQDKPIMIKRDKSKTNQRFHVQHQKYKIGDNHIYWYYCQGDINNKNICYIVPEYVLIQKGYFKNGMICKQISFYKETNPFVDYMFDYRNFDVDKFKNLTKSIEDNRDN